MNIEAKNEGYGLGFKALTLPKGNRMLRIGFGQNNSKWFARVDLWFYGLRITTNQKNSESLVSH